MNLTINWQGTADALLAQDPPGVYRMFNPVPEHVIAELAAKLPDFRRGYEDEGLHVADYDEFGRSSSSAASSSRVGSRCLTSSISDDRRQKWLQPEPYLA